MSIDFLQNFLKKLITKDKLENGWLDHFLVVVHPWLPNQWKLLKIENEEKATWTFTHSWSWTGHVRHCIVPCQVHLEHFPPLCEGEKWASHLPVCSPFSSFFSKLSSVSQGAGPCKLPSPESCQLTSKQGEALSASGRWEERSHCSSPLSAAGWMSGKGNQFWQRWRQVALGSCGLWSPSRSIRRLRADADSGSAGGPGHAGVPPTLLLSRGRSSPVWSLSSQLPSVSSAPTFRVSPIWSHLWSLTCFVFSWLNLLRYNYSD